MIKKLMITPWFGQLPSWFDRYLSNIEELKPLGYDWLITTNIDNFCKRVRDKLGIEPQIEPGHAKVHDFRASLGILFEEELKGYDFWGHTDFDCVYGRVDKFIPDSELENLDIHSNHRDYMCGPWSLYRNDPKINNLFREFGPWGDILQTFNPTGWVEKEFTQIVDQHANSGDIRRKYTHFQSHTPDDLSQLKKVGLSLFDGEDEIMMAHFNRKKIYPLYV